jgi:hypothetical protein
MGAPIAPGAAVIVTPERDEALLGAIAGTGVGGDRVIRWREVLANLGAMEEGNLAAAAERCARDERPRRRCA